MADLVRGKPAVRSVGRKEVRLNPVVARQPAGGLGPSRGRGGVLHAGSDYTSAGCRFGRGRFVVSGRRLVMAYVASRDGTRIGYERTGSGPVVILIDGA